MSTVEVDVTLSPGWVPLAPVPGLLVAAVAADDTGAACATLVVRMMHLPAVADRDDAATVAAAVPRNRDDGVREVRWCAPGVVAVLAASPAPGALVTPADLADALRQTAVYAVDSTGRAIRSSSAGDANAE